MYKNILVPIDGSALSRSAAREAVAFAKAQGAKVVGFYVAPAYQPNVYADFVPASFVSPKEYDELAKKTADKYLSVVEKAAKAAGVSCTCAHAMSDLPYEEIIKAAQRHKCDLIFMASHGRSGIARLLLGSQTSKVLAHTKVPVLVHR
ncbi:MAG: universal stress protein [Betaproteobacteria bacterium]|nr:universal stress protein [Betaproteobacteria bacterium]